ncbi:MAG: hypothetical protein ACREGR_04735, partial [Minisyncoccia bacterium]
GVFPLVAGVVHQHLRHLLVIFQVQIPVGKPEVIVVNDGLQSKPQIRGVQHHWFGFPFMGGAIWSREEVCLKAWQAIRLMLVSQ